MNRLSADGPLRAFLVDHNPDDLHIIGRIELLQDFFGVRHLRYRLRRDEGDGINGLETIADQGFQVVRLEARGDLPGKPLPGIARTCDEFYWLRHADSFSPRFAASSRAAQRSRTRFAAPPL